MIYKQLLAYQLFDKAPNERSRVTFNQPQIWRELAPAGRPKDLKHIERA